MGPDPNERSWICLITDQSMSDQIAVTLRSAVEAILPRWEAAARGAGSLGALEAAVDAAVRTPGLPGVTAGAQRLAAGSARTLPGCATCGPSLRRVGMRPGTVLGIFGAYPLPRPYEVCPHGHGGGAPADAWGLGGRDSLRAWWRC